MVAPYIAIAMRNAGAGAHLTVLAQRTMLATCTTVGTVPDMYVYNLRAWHAVRFFGSGFGAAEYGLSTAVGPAYTRHSTLHTVPVRTVSHGKTAMYNVPHQQYSTAASTRDKRQEK